MRRLVSSQLSSPLNAARKAISINLRIALIFCVNPCRPITAADRFASVITSLLAQEVMKTRQVRDCGRRWLPPLPTRPVATCDFYFKHSYALLYLLHTYLFHQNDFPSFAYRNDFYLTRICEILTVYIKLNQRAKSWRVRAIEITFIDLSVYQKFITRAVASHLVRAAARSRTNSPTSYGAVRSAAILFTPKASLRLELSP